MFHIITKKINELSSRKIMTMNPELKINKPEPILAPNELATFYRGADVKETIKTLEAGEFVLITEFYNNGSDLLKELQRHLNKKLPIKRLRNNANIVLYIINYLTLF